METPAKIERLTAEQDAELPRFRARYLQHGINTAPADRPRAEAAFARAYRVIGREPVPVVWVGSPLSASIAFAALKRLLSRGFGISLGTDFWASLRDSLGTGLEARLGDSLWDSLGASLRDSLEDSLRASLWASLETSLEDSLRASLRDSLRGSLRDSLWNSLGDSLWTGLRDSEIKPQFTYWWGQQDLYWIAFYKFCAEIGVQYNVGAADRLDIMHEIGLSCMWWYPCNDLIVACERPSVVRLDDRERLHCDNGPAVAFRDGWKIYAVHGVRVPAWLIEEPEKLTLAAIQAETNSEVQRVMIERFGWDRYADECGAEIVDHDEQWGTLMRAGASGHLFVRVINGTPEPDGSFRKYILPVADNCAPIPDPDDPQGELGDAQGLTALNAVASTYGLTGEAYRALKVRT